MKKLLLILGVLAFTFTSCGEKKKEEVKKEAEPVKEEVKTTETTSEVNGTDEQIAMGAKLFTEKTCTTCHALDTKIIGPAVKDIVKKYEESNGNIVDFLTEKSNAIVDTDPGQVAIMKANLDGFVKDLTPEELQAIAAYMHSTVK